MMTLRSIRLRDAMGADLEAADGSGGARGGRRGGEGEKQRDDLCASLCFGIGVSCVLKKKKGVFFGGIFCSFVAWMVWLIYL